MSYQWKENTCSLWVCSGERSFHFPGRSISPGIYMFLLQILPLLSDVKEAFFFYSRPPASPSALINISLKFTAAMRTLLARVHSHIAFRCSGPRTSCTAYGLRDFHRRCVDIESIGYLLYISVYRDWKTWSAPAALVHWNWSTIKFGIYCIIADALTDCLKLIWNI